ncbi:MAG: 23S rRNA (pseudouridine(1915)-N(3))-methyltransferase RlmH [Devosiaceae bacterium]|nr:23S rRNA (pseudouridine(1915)-N(3))-methyltransferase RlmH [Devosiaceae bacterium]
MKAGTERELLNRYIERAQKTGKVLSLTFNIVEIIESRLSSASARKKAEAKEISKNTPKKAIIIALDERGKSISSLKFANNIANWRDEGKSDICFVIGGADGLNENITSSANMMLAFSSLTWPHQLVRIMLSEQLYRTTTILSNHPYHREG